MTFNTTLLLAWTALTIAGCSIIEFIIHKFNTSIAGDQRRYISKNIFKSFALTFLACYTTEGMWNLIINNVRNAEVTSLIHQSGLMYVEQSLQKLFNFHALGMPFLIFTL